MDFITGLPPNSTTGATTIMIVTNRLGKGSVICGLTDESVKAVADAYVAHVVGHHGFPDAIVSDRGPQFTSVV